MQPLLELNPAESIFAAFHDEYFSSKLRFHLTPGSAAGFRRVISWDSTRLLWDECPTDAPVGTATLHALLRDDLSSMTADEQATLLRDARNEDAAAILEIPNLANRRKATKWH